MENGDPQRGRGVPRGRKAEESRESRDKSMCGKKNDTNVLSSWERGHSRVKTRRGKGGGGMKGLKAREEREVGKGRKGRTGCLGFYLFFFLFFKHLL